jgi:hypothetical protein
MLDSFLRVSSDMRWNITRRHTQQHTIERCQSLPASRCWLKADAGQPEAREVCTDADGEGRGSSTRRLHTRQCHGDDAVDAEERHLLLLCMCVRLTCEQRLPLAAQARRISAKTSAASLRRQPPKRRAHRATEQREQSMGGRGGNGERRAGRGGLQQEGIEGRRQDPGASSLPARPLSVKSPCPCHRKRRRATGLSSACMPVRGRSACWCCAGAG